MRLLILLAALTLSAADWPRFRGPNGSGVATDTGLPTEFSVTKNVAWKTAVPFGRSSPIVVGNRIFLTASEGENLLTLAIDASSGRQLWRRELKRSHTQSVYKANDAASPTPTADDNGVYAFFPDFGLIAYTPDGKERWRHPLGPFDSFYGVSSSPIIAGGLIFQLCDVAQGSFLIAIDKDSGRQRWRAERPEHTAGWSIPIVYKDQLIAVGSNRIDSYHLTTGEHRWWTLLPSNGAMGTPVIHGEQLIVTASGSDQPWLPSFAATIAKLDKDSDGKISTDECKDEKEWAEHFGWVDANHDKLIDAKEWETARAYGVGEYGAVSISLSGKGRLAPTAINWRFKRNLPYIPAPVLFEGVFYMVKTGGIITTLDPATGQLLKQGRTPQATGEYFASPVAADGKVFLVNSEGKLTVLKATPQWEVIAVNDLEDEVFASPAISGNRIFVRTRGTLYAFAASRI